MRVCVPCGVLCEFNALLDAAVHKKSGATCETPNSLTFSTSQMEVETSFALDFPHFLEDFSAHHINNATPTGPSGDTQKNIDHERMDRFLNIKL